MAETPWMLRITDPGRGEVYDNRFKSEEATHRRARLVVEWLVDEEIKDRDLEKGDEHLALLRGIQDAIKRSREKPESLAKLKEIYRLWREYAHETDRSRNVEDVFIGDDIED